MKDGKRNNALIAALVTIVLGILFLIFKGDVIQIALTIVGAVMIIMSFVDFKNRQTLQGVVKLILGVCVIVFGWIFVNIALYIIAGVLLLLGITQIVSAIRNNSSGAKKVLSFLVPIGSLAAGICLFFNQGGTVNWVFTVAGILLIVQGILALANSKK